MFDHRRSRRSDHQLIPNTCYGFDLYAAGFDLPAQMRHVDIDGAGLAVEVESPGFLQDLLAAEDESAVFSQGEEKVKFLGAQVEAAGVDAHFPSRGIDRQVTEMDRRSAIRFTFCTSQDRFNAGNQFTRVEWLGEVIICTEFKAKNFIDILITGREHEDGCFVVHGSDAAADFEAIQPGKHDIQYNKSGMFACNHYQCCLTITGRLDAEPFALEIQARQLNDGWLVVYEEDKFVHVFLCQVTVTCVLIAAGGIDQRDTFDLDQRGFGQCRHLDRAARRRVLGEVFSIDGVHAGEVAHILQKDSGLDDKVQT